MRGTSARMKSRIKYRFNHTFTLSTSSSSEHCCRLFVDFHRSFLRSFVFKTSLTPLHPPIHPLSFLPITTIITTTTKNKMSSPTSHVSPTPELSTPPRGATDPLSTGIKSLLDPTVKQTTEKLLQVHQSQQALSRELDRLINRMYNNFPPPAAKIGRSDDRRGRKELQHYLDTTDPPSLRPTVIKLASTGKRLAAVNSE